MDRNFAIIGYPLGHTMSPPIHKALFDLAGESGDYQILELAPEILQDSYQKLRGLSGYNITIPHKVGIMPMLDALDETAKRYGAVNCVKNGERAIGYNTDVVGFTRSVEAMGASLSSKVVLLGCGGVGRMMGIETAMQGGELTIAVREADYDAAQALAAEIDEKAPGATVAVTTLDKIEGHFDLMINATPVGMYPHADASPVEASVLSQVNYLFEAIYNPTQTKLMRMAIEKGVKCCGGMAMLVWQAVIAHEIWDNSVYDEADITALIARMEAQVKQDFPCDDK